MWKKILLAGLIGLLLAGCGDGCRQSEELVPAPDFKLKGVDGKEVSLSDYRGKVVFLDFWATWCSPCKEEMPSISRLYRMMKAQGVEVLAVSEDTDVKDVLEFIDLHEIPFRVVMDHRRTAYELFRVQALPAAFLIDQNGMIRAKKLGAFDWSSPSVVEAVRALTDPEARGHAGLLEPGTVKLAP